MGLELRRKLWAVNTFMVLTAVVEAVLWDSGSRVCVCVCVDNRGRELVTTLLPDFIFIYTLFLN